MATAQDILKQVVTDPTTYAPTAIGWVATQLDWNSSQVYFQHGAMEHNPYFTKTGISDSEPVSYRHGNEIIAMDALFNLQWSMINNTGSRVLEHVLIHRYPEKQKAIRVAGWIERIAVAVGLGYIYSEKHFSQWQLNTSNGQY